MQQDSGIPGGRRLAVQLHNRKHPPPVGAIIVACFVVLAIGIGAWMWKGDHDRREKAEADRKYEQDMKRDLELRYEIEKEKGNRERGSR